MKFLEMFNPVQKGNFALTDEVVYNSIQNNDELIPLYGGNKSHKQAARYVSKTAITKEGKPITIFDGEGIIISLDGSSGSMTYKNGERFALNHHAGFITLKDEGIVRLEFFALFFQNFLRNLSVSDGSKTLSLAQLYSAEFEMPDYDLQCRVLEKILPMQNKIEKLTLIQEQYTELLNRQIGVLYSGYQATNVPISEAIECMSGNSGLTEEFIYSTTQISGDRYKVLSSATDENTMMGEVPKCILKNKQLKVFENKEGLLVTRNGKAGETVYLAPGRYTINDHAYILYNKKSYPHYVNLKWLAIQYKAEFLSYSSASDNGTWNKTGFFNNTLLDIPLKEEQLRIVALYDELRGVIDKIEAIKREYEKVLSKEVV